MSDLIGKSIATIDSFVKVTGAALYPGDVNLPAQLVMHTVFSSRVHALIRQVDCSRAAALPGVIAVLTARDVPCNEYGLISQDQPVLCGPGSTKLHADRVRFIGDQVALVLAETESIAVQAAERIDIDYQELPVLSDPLQAMLSDATLLHPQLGSNILCRKQLALGDISEGFAAASVQVSAEYRTPAQEHAFLQPEAGLALVDEDGRIQLTCSGQWAHNDQGQIAHALGLPREQVHVKYASIGGAFGGKEDISVQITLALSAWALHRRGIHRPVKTVWTRQESLIGHHKRHPFIIRSRWGADANGKIVAAEMKIIADGGAYASASQAVLSSAVILSTGPYAIPNVSVDGVVVYTNNIPSGAFRGFGSPQVTFAAESQVNRLAWLLGMDPVEIRLRNAISEGQLAAVGTPLPAGISIAKVIRACAHKSGWRETNAGWKSPIGKKRRGVRTARKVKGLGFAIGYKSFGIPPDESHATVELHGSAEIEKAVIRFAGADMGQGARTVYAQYAAQALQLPLEKITVLSADTDLGEDSGSASASRLTFMAGNSILQACEIALQKWNHEERPAIGSFHYQPPVMDTEINGERRQHPNFGYGYVAEAVRLSLDVETGQIEIGQVNCAIDVGRAVNPIQVLGQTEGALVQALGYSILEDLQMKEGNLLSRNLSTYLIPTISDIPVEMNSFILEEPDANGPLGARGMAEMPLVALAPAITAAIHDACGIWMDSLPLTPERIRTALDRIKA
jgi:CO/xanthine dehydrogenase Mo-binding subunit